MAVAGSEHRLAHNRCMEADSHSHALSRNLREHVHPALLTTHVIPPHPRVRRTPHPSRPGQVSGPTVSLIRGGRRRRMVGGEIRKMSGGSGWWGTKVRK